MFSFCICAGDISPYRCEIASISALRILGTYWQYGLFSDIWLLRFQTKFIPPDGYISKPRKTVSSPPWILHIETIMYQNIQLSLERALIMDTQFFLVQFNFSLSVIILCKYTTSIVRPGARYLTYRFVFILKIEKKQHLIVLSM